MFRALAIFAFLASIFLAGGFPLKVLAEGGVPLTLPLFQNDDGTCQTEDVVREAYTIACGSMTEDSADGHKIFPDCITVSERRRLDFAKPQIIDFLTFLPNENLHTSDPCPKEQLSTPKTIQLSLPEGGTALPEKLLGSIQAANFDRVHFDDFVYPQVPTTGSSRLEDWLGAPGGGFNLLGDLIPFPSTYPRTPQIITDLDDQVAPFRTDPFQRNTSDRCASLGNVNGKVCPAEKNTAVFDCNNDGFLDLTVAVYGRVGSGEAQKWGVFTQTVKNAGGVLLGIPDTAPHSEQIVPLQPPASPIAVATALDSGDFNKDGNPDLALVVDIDESGHRDNQFIRCLHVPDPNKCDFNCGTHISLSKIVTDADFKDFGNGAGPYSIVTGDFNGDDQEDVAISLIGTNENKALLSRILYMFANASGGFQIENSLQVSTTFSSLTGTEALLSVDGNEMTDVVPTSLTTGHFDNDGVVDLAVTNYHASPGTKPYPSNSKRFRSILPQGFVLILRSDETSGANFKPKPTPLEFPVQDLEVVTFQENLLLRAPYDRASGIASADFDHCGGDDIIALAEECLSGRIDGTGRSPLFGECSSKPGSEGAQWAGQRQAVLFLNANEAPEVELTPDLPEKFQINVPVALPATCKDPTRDRRHFSWSALSSPPGGAVEFETPQGDLIGNSNNASTMMTVHVPGNYTIELLCTDFCDLSTAKTTRVKFSFTATQDPPGALPTEPLPTAQETPLGTSSQGGNLFCGLGVGTITGHNAWIRVFLMFLPIVWFWLKRK